jgi:hypothetical protein
MTDKPGERSKPLFNPLALRKIHSYIGALISPSILFFAVTGAYQLFGLHDARPGSAYQPPAILAELSAVHKDQKFELAHHDKAPDASGAAHELAHAPSVASADHHHAAAHHDIANFGNQLLK